MRALYQVSAASMPIGTMSHFPLSQASTENSMRSTPAASRICEFSSSNREPLVIKPILQSLPWRTPTVRWPADAASFHPPEIRRYAP